MDLELAIRPDWQFGRGEDPLVDRAGTATQAVALAIQRYLFTAPVAAGAASSAAAEGTGTGGADPSAAAAGPQRTLRADSVPEPAPAATEAGAARLAAAAVAFGQAASAVSWPHDGQRALLEPFGDLCTEQGATALFSQALHALCWSMAAARLEQQYEEAPPADLEDGADDADAGPAERQQPGPSPTPGFGTSAPFGEPLLGVEQSVAVSAVARALLAAQPRRRGRAAAAAQAVGQSPEPAPQADGRDAEAAGAAPSAGPQPVRLPAAEPEPAQPSAEHARLVAKVLVQALVDGLPDLLAADEPQQVTEDGQPRTRQRIVLRSAALSRRVTQLLLDLPLRFTVQPLAQPAAYLRPGDAEAEDGERAVRVPLVGYRRTNAFLRRFHAQVLRHADFKAYVQAVDRQQAVAWRINRPLCLWAFRLRQFASPREGWTAEMQQAVAQAGMDDAAVQDLQAWLAGEFYRPPQDRRRRASQESPADFLDNPLAQRALLDLTAAGEDGTPPSFYLPWKADYRGRIYAETPWLSPQGGDLQRALFEFAHGQILDDSGVRALRRHGANLAQRGVLLRDLGIRGRQVLTLEEREQWVQQHENEIVASARAPLAHRFWRDAAAKPMQFLAFCLAYAQWKDDPRALIHLPVQIDGTCNGLQHIAALTGDQELARAVNVLPREDGLPGDIYSELAERARMHFGTASAQPAHEAASSSNPDAEAGSQPIDELALGFARCLLATRPDLLAALDRSAAKAVVMTVPYGASERAQAESVVEVLAGPRGSVRAVGDKPVPLQALLAGQPLQEAELRDLDTLTAKVAADPMARSFVGRCTKGRFAALWQRAEAGDAAAGEEVRRLRVLSAYVALAMVRELRAALGERFPGVPAFGGWLAEVARRCAGLPLMWQTPLGLPVCQDRFGESRSTLQSTVGGRRISIGTTVLGEVVDHAGQGRQLLPNLVHSLDATHLAMAINQAGSQGVEAFGSIHDCVLCRPNEAETMAAVLRQTFARLYRPEAGTGRPRVLSTWQPWMALLAQLAGSAQLHLLKGALENPQGFGEQMLRQQAEAGTDADAKAAARQTVSLLDAVRALPDALQRMAMLLIDYLKEVPMAGAGGAAGAGQPKRPKHPPGNTIEPAPGAAALALGGKVPSRYFFC